MNKYNILITGGAGFIGSHLVKHYLEKEEVDKVIVIDALYIGGSTDNLPIDNDKLELIVMDLNNEKLEEEIDKYEPKYVVHMAAHTHVDRSIENGIPFGRSNVMGTINLMESLKNKEYLEKILVFSTDETLGVRLEGEMYEDDKLTPRNVYSASKAGQEMMADGYRITHKTPCVISRCSNAYGPNQWPEKLLPVIINKVLKGEKIPVYGKGDQLREWTYVKDICRAVETILKKSEIGQIWHISSNEEKVNLDVIKYVVKKLGKDPNDFIEFVEDRKGHDFRYCLNCARLKEAGWKPEFDFEDGMKETIEWYVKKINS